MAQKKKTSTKQKSKKFDQNKLWFVIIVIVICVILVSSIKYSEYRAEKKLDEHNYQEFQFYYDSSAGLWFTQIQIGRTPYVIPFYFHPSELEDIPVEEGVEDIILEPDSKPENIIISIPSDSTPEMGIAAVEISSLTGERFEVIKVPTTSAFYEYVEGVPYATCEHSSDETVVIMLKKSSRNIVSSENRCIILEFKEGDEIKVADAFAYRLIKIM